MTYLQSCLGFRLLSYTFSAYQILVFLAAIYSGLPGVVKSPTVYSGGLNGVLTDKLGTCY